MFRVPAGSRYLMTNELNNARKLCCCAVEVKFQRTKMR